LLEHYLAADITAGQGVDPDELSAWYATDPLLATGEGDRLVTGYDALLTELLEDLEILPSSAVVNVTSSERGVALRLARGDSLSADRVVITVPLGVLQAGTIEFDPPLPFSNRGAISALGMARQEKLVLRYDTAFWSTDAVLWATVGGDADFPLWVNLEPITGEAILVATMGGDTADRLAKYTDAELLDAAMASLVPFVDPDHSV
jgi:monoamine oxidase